MVMTVIRKHHSFIASSIVYSCLSLVNNTCVEFVIFPGITFYIQNQKFDVNGAVKTIGIDFVSKSVRVTMVIIKPCCS